MSESNVKLISVTSGVQELLNKNAQEIIAFTARVSNPSNQMNTETAPKLMSYLIKNKHWSPFEMCHFTVEITTSRAIAQQILRHRSFSFQEFSQRYAQANDFILYEARRQDTKNRQNSIDDMDEETKNWFKNAQDAIWSQAKQYYDTALAAGIAKEQARFLLPLNTQTTLYMCGSVRSWIHYLELRGISKGTQLEHRLLALDIIKIFKKEFPDIYEALGWEELL